MRIIVLWSHIAEYMYSNLLQLAESGNEVFCLYLGTDINNPLKIRGMNFEQGKITFLEVEKGAKDIIRDSIESFSPELSLTGGWNIKLFRKIHLNRNYISILAMDNPWSNTFKQQFGVHASKFFLKPYFDAALVPGTRQEEFAKRLGFDKEKISRNLFPLNQKVYSWDNTQAVQRRDFLFVGRLVESKGLDFLIDAFDLYCKMVSNPWKLKIVGTGPMIDQIKNRPNVEYLGHKKAWELLELYRTSRCFVFPSTYEAWGIVIQEAASQGLPSIATANVGSTADLIEDNVSGLIIENLNAKTLCDAMIKIHNLTDGGYKEMTLAALSSSNKYESRSFSTVIQDLYIKCLI
jgi:glycosyltransferase involved in cell wall biosynthesis